MMVEQFAETRATPASARQVREATLHDYLAILYRRRFIAAAVLLLTIGYAVWSSAVTPPSYSSTTTLVVERAPSGLDRLTDGLVGSNATAELWTLAEILKSRLVATRALKRANLDTTGVDNFRDNIVVAPVRNASVINLSVIDRFPDRAAVLANALAQEFIGLSLEVRKRQAVAARKFLEDQVATVGREVQSTENRLLAFKVRQGNIDLSSVVSIQVGRLADFETQRILAAVDQQVAGRRRQELLRQAGLQTRITSSTFTQDPTVNILRTSLAQAEVDLAVLRERYTEEHPLVITARERTAELQRGIARAVARGLEPAGYQINPILAAMEAEAVAAEVEVITGQARAEAMATLANRLSREIAKLPPKELELARLTRDEKIAEGTFLLLSQRYQDARIVEASVVPEVRVLDQAEVPSRPFAPDMRRNIILGTVIGLVAAFGAAMGADHMDRNVRTPEDAEQATGLPILAIIPSFSPRVRRRGRAGEFEVRGDLLIADHAGRRSSLAEMFRGLRTSLMLTSSTRPLGTIMVTSVFPGEGRTIVAANLAISFAQLNRRVWLIEADLRQHRLDEAFPSANRQGLADYLAGAAELSGVVKPVADHPRLSFVPAGSDPSNPAELLGSQQMRAFLDHARKHADTVVCDSAPLVPVADSLLLAPEVDGVLLVVEVGRVPREVLYHVHRRLMSAGAQVLGVVLLTSHADGVGYGYGSYHGRLRYGGETVYGNGGA